MVMGALIACRSSDSGVSRSSLAFGRHGCSDEGRAPRCRQRGVPAPFEQFLTHYGTRGPNEWDIGSDPWNFRPQMATAAIGAMRAAADSHSPQRQLARLRQVREDVVAEVRDALNPIDRFQFEQAYRATVLFSQARERWKTTVVKAFHAVRRAQEVMHERARDAGGADERWKSCLLEVDEFEQYLDDPGSFTDLIAQRAELHGRLTDVLPPFIVRETVPPLDTWEPRSTGGRALTPGATLQGIAG